jgi:predicted RecA/RadA family phage recombinase
MALNEIYKDADSIVFPVHTSVVSGDAVKVGDIVGVAENSAVTGEDGNTYATLKLNGAFEIPVKSGDTFTVGQKAYGVADSTTGVIPEVQESATSAKFVGHVIKTVAGFAIVKLGGVEGPAGPQGPAGE